MFYSSQLNLFRSISLPDRFGDSIHRDTVGSCVDVFDVVLVVDVAEETASRFRVVLGVADRVVNAFAEHGGQHDCQQKENPNAKNAKNP